VVDSEGLSAGGGACSTTVDPGVPLGPGLLATWVESHGPQARMANTTTTAATIRPSVRRLIGAFRSWLSCMLTLPSHRGETPSSTWWFPAAGSSWRWHAQVPPNGGAAAGPRPPTFRLARRVANGQNGQPMPN